MRHRLTDFDLAVLAALQIGVVRGVRISRSQVDYTMNGVNVWPSLLRLEQAGEIYIAPNQEPLLVGSAKYQEVVKFKEVINAIRKGVRTGEIKLPKIKKGQ